MPIPVAEQVYLVSLDQGQIADQSKKFKLLPAKVLNPLLTRVREIEKQLRSVGRRQSGLDDPEDDGVRQTVELDLRTAFLRNVHTNTESSWVSLTPGLRAWTKVSKNQWNLFLLICNATSEIYLFAINLLFSTHFLVSWCLFWKFNPRGHEWTIFGLCGTSAPDQFSLMVVSAHKIFRFVKIFGLFML